MSISSIKLLLNSFLKVNIYTILIFNKFIAPSQILSELAIRVFTGSRDVPKDSEKAIHLFEFSDKNS